MGTIISSGNVAPGNPSKYKIQGWEGPRSLITFYFVLIFEGSSKLVTSPGKHRVPLFEFRCVNVSQTFIRVSIMNKLQYAVGCPKMTTFLTNFLTLLN